MKNNKGITLVILVVTIILLLILTSVSVTYVIKDEGIIETAKRSKFNSEVAEIQEKMELIKARPQYLKKGIDGENLKAVLQEELNEKIWNKYIETNKLGIQGEELVYIANVEEGETVTITPKEIEFAIKYGLNANTSKWRYNEDQTKIWRYAKDGTKQELIIGAPVNYQSNQGSIDTSEYQGMFISNDDKDGTISTEKFDWVIFGVNENGQIEILPTGITNEKIYFKFCEENREYFLKNYKKDINEVCNILYGKGKYAASGRAICIKDIGCVENYAVSYPVYGKNTYDTYDINLDTLEIYSTTKGTYLTVEEKETEKVRSFFNKYINYMKKVKDNIVRVPARSQYNLTWCDLNQKDKVAFNALSTDEKRMGHESGGGVWAADDLQFEISSVYITCYLPAFGYAGDQIGVGLFNNGAYEHECLTTIGYYLKYYNYEAGLLPIVTLKDDTNFKEVTAAGSEDISYELY